MHPASIQCRSANWFYVQVHLPRGFHGDTLILRFILSLVSLYQYQENTFLLMACSARYIIIFKSELKRVDRWQLGSIERGSEVQHGLTWHEGLIISMGFIGLNKIYMFTEREFLQYSIIQGRVLDSRILPRGSDESSQTTSHPYDEPQRGIGTIHEGLVYHIYLNQNDQWTLYKSTLEKLALTMSYNLTVLFPDVQRFVHICANSRTLNFLVQLEDSSYALAFRSLNACTPIEGMPPVHLPQAVNPRTVCSTLIDCLKRDVYFINDPLAETLHILDNHHYLLGYSVAAYAICAVEEKQELMVLTTQSICSMDLRGNDGFFSQFS